MDWNGDKLASYSILALNHSAAAFNTAWTLSTKFIGNCTDQDQHCALETNSSFSPGAQIVWPGSCEDRIYKAVAQKRFGEWLFLADEFVLRCLQFWKCAESTARLSSVWLQGKALSSRSDSVYHQLAHTDSHRRWCSADWVHIHRLHHPKKEQADGKEKSVRN